VNGLRISNKIRGYILGILYLILASFILGAITYIANNIPDVTISPSGAVSTSNPQYKPAILVVQVSNKPNSIYYIGGSPVCEIVYTGINLNAPDSGRAWLIVVTPPSGIQVNSLTFYIKSNSYGGYTQVSSTNAGDGNYYALWNGGIPEIDVDINSNTAISDPIPLKIYSVDANIPIPPPSGYLPNPQNNNSAPAISNKTIISFIGWITGVILVITALHKFDIWI